MIRDTPKMRCRHGACVARALLARPPGARARCSKPPRSSVTRDDAAARLEMPASRVRSVDLTRLLLRPRCYPVVGGALVLRDQHHMTGAFSSRWALPTGRAGVYGPVGVSAR